MVELLWPTARGLLTSLSTSGLSLSLGTDA